MPNDVVASWAGSVRGRLDWMLEARHATAAVGFIRCVYGLTTFALLVSSWTDRHLFFGPTGLFSSPELNAQWRGEDSWSVFDLAQSVAAFEVLYGAAMLVAGLTMLGIGGKPMLVLQYVVTWSVFSQNPLLGDGGDNIMYICGLFLILTQCFERFRVLPRRKALFRRHSLPWLLNLSHNTGIILIAVQICIVYFIAGTFKMQGEMWTSGTALYYVLRNPEYHLPGLELLFHFAFPSIIGSYVTVLSQVLFPFLMLFRQARLPAVILMMTFHISIMVVMGLTSFGLIMFACDTVFVNRHLTNLIDKFKGSDSRVTTKEMGATEPMAN
ncbi:HTTM domain-containing protein [Arthrobacter sp. NPDC097144]|uniref:HTTM domain-containing protein n=1 Tax=Arthrobacter sp. NPDC097144 TaxID=3363946 RepID=UPI00381A026A